MIDPEDEYTRLARAVGGAVPQLGALGARSTRSTFPRPRRRGTALTRACAVLFIHAFVGVLLGRT